MQYHETTLQGHIASVALVPLHLTVASSTVHGNTALEQEHFAKRLPGQLLLRLQPCLSPYNGVSWCPPASVWGLYVKLDSGDNNHVVPLQPVLGTVQT